MHILYLKLSCLTKTTYFTSKINQKLEFLTHKHLQIDRVLENKQELKKQLQKMHKKKGKAGSIEKIFKLVKQGLKLGRFSCLI
jgi:hypothetical protein